MDEVNVEQVLRILHLEDDPADSEMARQLLRKGGLEARIDRVYTMDALRQQLESESYALILSDYTIPGVDALDALRLARQACPQTPYIFLSGTLGEDVAIETLKMGATDYVLKQRLERLVPAVRRALQESEAQNRRRQAETALRQSEELYRTTFENAAVGIAHVAPDGNWLSVNDRLCQITGYTRAELLGGITFQSITYPEDLPADLQQLEQLLEGRIQTYRLEKRCIHKDGHLVWVNLTVSLRRDETGRPLDCIAVVEDITPRKQAEQALRESEQRVRASEERLRRAISIETVGVLFFNLDGRIIDANKAFEGMSGYSVEELRSAVHWENLTPPEFRDVTCQTAESLMTRGETAPYEKQIIRKDGSRWWGLFAPTRLSGSGRDSQCVEFIIDISERKRIEEALKELNEHLEQRVVERTAALERERRRLFDMLETLPVMIALFRPDHHVVFANRKFRDAFGEAHGRPCHEYIFGKELPCEFCQAFSVLETHQPVHWECLSPDGQRIIDVYNFPFTDVDGSPLVLEMDLDITEQRQAQMAMKEVNATLEQRVAERTAELVGANEKLAEADRRKDEFLAMLAHELRNPLAPVRNAVQILNFAGPKDPMLQRQREIIDRQVTHMARLLDDLLDVSRITRGKINLKKEPVRLADVLARAMETAAPLIEAHQHTLQVKIHSGEEQILGDFDRLLQIVGNLLTNAAKYTENGGRIWLESTREDETIVIRVRDTGMGIAPELLPKVFDVFTQAERSLDRSQGGLGLGLALVRSLTQMHGGSVEAHSVGMGQGSEFVVRLPALPLPEPVEYTCQPLPASSHDVAARRILVVDDVIDTANSLAELLNLMGHEVKAAYDGASALRIARDFRPDVILLDIGLPGMNGFEIARHLRRDPALEGVTLVAMTGYGQDEARRQAEAVGFDRHFTKPVEIHALKDLLERMNRQG